MKLSDFNYNLPKELIAHQPASPRDHSKLMVLDRQKKTISHKHFYDIIDYLKKGDVLVLNNTKVFPARLIGKRQDTGGKVEVFLLKRSKIKEQRTKSEEIWEVLIGNRRKATGQMIVFEKGLKCEIVKKIDDSVWVVRFNKSGSQLEKLVDEVGDVPTPPYIKNKDRRSKIKNDYQTVYAEHRGSVAAPTAGLHFTKSLIAKLKKKGVNIEFVTLHVGLGTFAPVKINNLKKHKMHSEYAVIDNQTAKRLNQAKKEGRRIISVGTTSTRTLEAFSDKSSNLKASSKWVDIFIYPGYKFKFINGMITNFHLPESTLIMLISAFIDRKFVLDAYKVAVKKKYRFYSFGDAMLIV